MAGDLPPGAFVPKHGIGFLKPAPPFKPGNQLGKRSKRAQGYRHLRKHKAADALKLHLPALAEAIQAPAPSKRAWWRKRYTVLTTQLGSNLAAERILLAYMMLRSCAGHISHGDNACSHCRQPFGSDAPLPLLTLGAVLGWVHPRCLAPAMQAIVMKARSELARALEPYSHNAGR